jgi:hypothetical protein
MALNYVGTEDGATRNLVLVLLKDSSTVAVGEVVKTYVSGYGERGAAATPLAGVVHSIGSKDNLPDVQGAHSAGSTNTSDLSTVTTAADNTTTELYWAMVDFSVNSKYSAEVSGTLGTTNNSDLRGCRIDIDSANTDYGRLLETTATRTVGTTANFYSHGVDPNDSTRLIVSLANSEKDSVTA